MPAEDTNRHEAELAAQMQQRRRPSADKALNATQTFSLKIGIIDCISLWRVCRDSGQVGATCALLTALTALSETVSQQHILSDCPEAVVWLAVDTQNFT